MYILTNFFFQLTALDIQGGDEEGGGGSDIGALLGALGPLSGSLSGVSFLSGDVLRIFSFRLFRNEFFLKLKSYIRNKMSSFMRPFYYLKFHKQEIIKHYASRYTLLKANYVTYNIKDEAQTALFKAPVRTAL